MSFNEPTFFYGPSVMLLPRDRTRTGSSSRCRCSAAYRLDENGEADRLYVNDLVVQGAAMVPIGQKLMADMGSFWSRLTLYGIVEQNLTPSRNFSTRKVDRFNPTFLYGVSISLRGESRERARERVRHPAPVSVSAEVSHVVVAGAVDNEQTSQALRASANKLTPHRHMATSQSRSPCAIQIGGADLV